VYTVELGIGIILFSLLAMASPAQGLQVFRVKSQVWPSANADNVIHITRGLAALPAQWLPP